MGGSGEQTQPDKHLVAGGLSVTRLLVGGGGRRPRRESARRPPGCRRQGLNTPELAADRAAGGPVEALAAGMPPGQHGPGQPELGGPVGTLGVPLKVR